MEGEKDNEQEMGMRKKKIPSMIEGIYSKKRHLGEQRKSQKYK